MESTVKGDYFTTQLNDTLKAISPKTTLLILTSIKIDTKGNNVISTGPDSEISIGITIPKQVDREDIVDITETGSVVLPGRFFVGIIKKLPGEGVRLSINEQLRTFITLGHSESNLSGSDPEQCPLLLQVSYDDAIQLFVKVPKDITAQTNFAVSTLEARPVLTGVNWLIQSNELIYTATDSYHLAVRKLKFEDESENKNVIVPDEVLSGLDKIMSDNSEDIDIFSTSNQMLFEVGNVNFTSRLLEGHYPDTTCLFPENYKIKLGLDNGEFYHVIDHASLLARESRNNVIKLGTGNEVIELLSTSPEIGTVKKEVTTTDIEGDNLRTPFNPKYMMDALKAIDSEEIEAELFGTMKPFILKLKVDDLVT